MLSKNIILVFALSLLWIFVFACKKGKREWDMSGPDKDPVIDLNEGDTTFNYIFRQRYEGYACYRIPALVHAKDGSLIAFAEARRNSCSDIGDIDLVMKRSTDNGKTWGPLVKIWDDGANTCGNPAPVLDESTGVIYLLMTWNFGTDDISDINKGTGTDTRRVFITSSSDNGAAWSAPKEITDAAKRPEWGWYATGPCHGIQLKQGPRAGRLIIPCDFIEKGAGGRSFSHVIFSDDHGATWQIGGVSPLDKANESAVAELSDGKLMLNMRHSGARYVATSEDFGITWKNMKEDAGLVDPTCQGSLLSAKVNTKHTLFFSNPASTRREKMTIKLSENDGVDWSKKYEVYKGPSAYSDLIMVSGSEIGILYEAGTASPYTGISFKIIPLTEFK